LEDANSIALEYEPDASSHSSRQIVPASQHNAAPSLARLSCLLDLHSQHYQETKQPKQCDRLTVGTSLYKRERIFPIKKTIAPPSRAPVFYPSLYWSP